MTGIDTHAFAAQAAEKLLHDMALVTLPIDPFEIARRKGIDVVAKPAHDAGVSGMLIRVGNNFAIAYATHIDSVPFQRFCVGHELGHYFLPGHPEAVLGASGVHESRAGFRSGDRYEIQADRFAAGLLMPRKLFVAAADKSGTGLAAIEALATLCQTSLHATAIRYTQCTSDPMAIVVSEGNTIDHCFMSDELKALDSIDWVRKRERVPKNTVTYGFNADPSNVQRAARADGSSNLQDWFGGRYNIEVCEDVIGLGSYGKTLTVLYDMELPDDEEREDEDSLTDSWTPRFRR